MAAPCPDAVRRQYAAELQRCLYDAPDTGPAQQRRDPAPARPKRVRRPRQPARAESPQRAPPVACGRRAESAAPVVRAAAAIASPPPLHSDPQTDRKAAAPLVVAKTGRVRRLRVCAAAGTPAPALPDGWVPAAPAPGRGHTPRAGSAVLPRGRARALLRQRREPVTVKE
eukprot:TRINITY_DN6916_c1_g1_i1.p2 TRINITY_DN6916_c1_g1~~TRINITY_DN6916_c1_g1_i1.p2  ORF type:complete len:170 (+),score=44.52 TRINITY_DN6916_c1_g1_i1:66-575(+)